MDAVIDVVCGQCQTKLRVKDALAGKKIKCRKCETVIAVPAAGPKPLPEEFKKPTAKAAPAKAKPAAPPADAPIKMAGDEDEDAKPYVVIKESDAPRCPHCAKELDPPDSLICLHCGYDLQDRKRKQSRAVIEHTFGDYLLHHLPAVLLLLVGIALIVGSVICWLSMSDWVTPWVGNGEKDAVTGKEGTYVKPWCFSLWICMMVIWIDWKIFKFCFIRFFINYTPPEKLIKKSD
jgi:predicted Zn finger-like uncharacterized protein